MNTNNKETDVIVATSDGMYKGKYGDVYVCLNTTNKPVKLAESGRPIYQSLQRQAIDGTSRFFNLLVMESGRSREFESLVGADVSKWQALQSAKKSVVMPITSKEPDDMTQMFSMFMKFMEEQTKK